MFIRDYALNTMIECDTARFWNAGLEIFGQDWDALVVWTHGA
ncbi:hypothetical protein [Zoogloea sp. 1C4]|nr:hypothetical protein [Zoogloea sp. 1C4]